MFKLVVLSALVAVAMAAPRPSGVIAAPVAVSYSAPLVAHSAVVGSVPTSVSSHSSTVVHSHAVHTSAVAAPLAVAHAAPIAVAQPLAIAHAAPLAVAHAAPVWAARTVVAGPVASSISHGLLNGHVATAPIGHVASPLIADVHAW